MMKTEGGSPSFGGSGYMDDEFYEDTGELAMPRDGPPKHVLLTRIPDWLYDHISKWDGLTQGNDNDQIVLGEVLSLPTSNAYDHNKNPSKDGKKPQTPDASANQPSMRIFFNNAWREKSGLPTAFEIEGQPVNDTMMANTYIFTEKDLPGYKHNGGAQNKAGANGAMQDPKARIFKPRTKYRKAIPKQTSLIGTATQQYLAKPLNTAEFLAFNTARTKEAIQGRHSRTNILTESLDEVTVMNNLQDHFTSFIRSDKKRKNQLNKYARLPRNELLDILHKCFDAHMYWPMATLKAHVKQPEAYLKEVLPTIGVLMKSGPFAAKWKRQDIFGRGSANEGAADEFIKVEDEDDDEEMEDVV
jgi:transcription initiation factor TFIIF subunit beta